MELTITFFIKFILVVHFILAIFFILLSFLSLNDQLNRYTIFKPIFLLKTPDIILHFFISPFRWHEKEM